LPIRLGRRTACFSVSKEGRGYSASTATAQADILISNNHYCYLNQD
jgi:hypothetical protein